MAILVGDMQTQRRSGLGSHSDIHKGSISTASPQHVKCHEAKAPNHVETRIFKHSGQGGFLRPRKAPHCISQICGVCSATLTTYRDDQIKSNGGKPLGTVIWSADGGEVSCGLFSRVEIEEAAGLDNVSAWWTGH